MKKDNAKIQEIIAEIKSEFGKEAIMLLGQKPDTKNETFSSGSIMINLALGIGGYPKGRIIEVFGPESSGKTTVALHAIAEIQKTGGIAAFIDAEHSIDPQYAKKLGVNIDNLILSQPDSGEQALEIVDVLVKTKAIDLIIIDSVAALVPEVELSGEMKDQTIGAQARLMSKALRKITGLLNKNKTTIIFINQIREKIGTFFGGGHVTPGGRALKFYSSIRIELKRISSVTSKKNLIGSLIRIKVVKNKLAPPFKIAETEIIFSHGISKEIELINLGLENQIITKNGGWYKYKGKNIANGKYKLWELLLKDKKLFDEIKNEIENKIMEK